MTENLSAQHALAIVENCPFPLLLMDRYQRVLGFNRAFAELVGDARASEMEGCSSADLGDHPANALLTGESSVCWTGQHGTPFHFGITDIALGGGDALRARLYIDISRQIELERAHESLNEELRQNILTDRVTGLLNQRGVMLALEPQVARSRRYNSPMAVIVMDLNSGDDTDRVRLHVARLLKDQLRWADLIGCSERREFMLILPETTAEAAVRLADKLTERVQDMTRQQAGALPVHVCYGVTGWRRSDNADTLLSRAGMALVQARSAQHTRAVAL
jgi:diguanylate cyclase (GGDEF)-like protein